jgi:hypothetical protein
MDWVNVDFRASRNLSTSTRNLSTTPATDDATIYKDGSYVAAENVIVIIIGILSVLANTLLLYVMYKDPLKIFRTKISYLVVCLGTADLLTSFNGVLYGFLFPMRMYHLPLWYTFWATVMVSVFTVFGMCAERWLAIVHPFKSDSIITKQVTLYFCFGVWIVCAGVATSIHFLPKVMPFVITSLLEVLLLLIVVLYLVILRYFRRAQRHTSAVDKVSPRKFEIDEESARQKPTKLTRRTAIETQLLIVVSILVLMLFVTFIPYNLGTQINYGYLLFANKRHPEISVFTRYFFPIKFLNFLINPFVYAWRLDQYRKSFVLVVCNWHGSRMKVHVISAATTPNRHIPKENASW